MARFKLPGCDRIEFDEPIRQNDWNTASFIQSTAIAYISYHPKKQILRIIFQTSRYRLYEYVEVPVEAVNKFLDCPYPRRIQLPSRSDSVGASFLRVIGKYNYDYRRKYSPKNIKFSYNPPPARYDEPQ
jgi:hypothetical protein